MPSVLVKSLAKKYSKSIDDVESKWNRAKAIVSNQYGNVDDHYGAVVSIVKKMLKGESVLIGIKYAKSS